MEPEKDECLGKTTPEKGGNSGLFLKYLYPKTEMSRSK